MLRVGGMRRGTGSPIPRQVAEHESAGIPAARSLADVELEHIQAVLQLVGGNRSEAARILQIGEATLYRRLRQISRANTK